MQYTMSFLQLLQIYHLPGDVKNRADSSHDTAISAPNVERRLSKNTWNNNFYDILGTMHSYCLRPSQPWLTSLVIS